MADVNFIKSTPGLLMILEMVGAIVAIACGASAYFTEVSSGNEWKTYIFSASCITLIIIFILFVVIVLQKLWDEKMLLGALFLCTLIMIVAVVLIFVKSNNFINTENVAFVMTILTTILLIVHILVKLGLVKA